MKRLIVIATTLTLAIAGCASLPQGGLPVEVSRELPRGYDTVWQQLVGLLANYNVQIKTIAKDSGVVYVSRDTFDESLADCGSRALFPLHRRVLDVNFLVTKIDAGATRVRVNARFIEVRGGPFGRVDHIECVSRGNLEGAVIAALERTMP